MAYEKGQVALLIGGGCDKNATPFTRLTLFLQESSDRGCRPFGESIQRRRCFPAKHTTQEVVTSLALYEAPVWLNNA